MDSSTAENMVIYDWLSFTSKDLSPDQLIEILGLSHVSWILTKGARGYQDRKYFGSIVIGVNDAKQTLMQRLRIKEPGPGCWHFPIDRDAEWFTQVTAEVIKTRMVKGRPVREWVPRTEGHPCEALDCRVYAFAALRGLMRNWKFDLNAAYERLLSYPLRNGQVPTSNGGNQTTSPTVRSRVRSKGISL